MDLDYDDHSGVRLVQTRRENLEGGVEYTYRIDPAGHELPEHLAQFADPFDGDAARKAYRNVVAYLRLQNSGST